MKTNFKSKPLTEVQEQLQERQPQTMYEELHKKCWCIAGNREEHTRADPRCAFYVPALANQPKMLPLPRDSAPPENSNRITSGNSMFRNQGDPPYKKTEEVKFDPPVTAEMEMLCAAYNRAMVRNPRDCSEMLDGAAMSLKFIKHVVSELHLMGWNCQQEEIPFGGCC